MSLTVAELPKKKTLMAIHFISKSQQKHARTTIIIT